MRCGSTPGSGSSCTSHHCVAHVIAISSRATLGRTPRPSQVIDIQVTRDPRMRVLELDCSHPSIISILLAGPELELPSRTHQSASWQT